MRPLRRVVPLLLLLSVLLCCGCKRLHTFTYTDGLYTDQKTGVSYRNITVRYEPISVGEDYGKCTDLTLRRIGGLDPALWLTETYRGYGSVFCAESVTLPGSLREFAPTSVIFCRTEDGKNYKIGDSTDAELLAALTDTLEEGERLSSVQSLLGVYELKFVSDTWPGLYFCIACAIDQHDQMYLYDRAERVTVSAGDLLRDTFAEQLAELHALWDME